MVKYVYDFSEGDKSMKDLLGGKGANLAEMQNQMIWLEAHSSFASWGLRVKMCVRNRGFSRIDL